MGTHVAWAESSAVAFCNSVLGARTNREGGPGAVAAAITGRTGAYGLHLEENRLATVRVEVPVQPKTIAEYSALGALVGSRVQRSVPLFANLTVGAADALREDKLKALGAAMAATGAVALYHVAGVTPEVLAGPVLADDYESLIIDDLGAGYAALSDEVEQIDLVWMGCPHASLAEIAEVAKRLSGSHLRVPLWITCARPVRDLAAERGWVRTIEAAGGRVFADACMAIAPVRELGFRAVATPSAKGAYYLRNLARVAVRFGPLDACIDAARTGGWPDAHRSVTL
jgi:predicted aconitase